MTDPDQGRGRRLGYLLAVAASVFWGTSGVFATTLFRWGVPPTSVALLRPAIGAALLLPCFYLWGRGVRLPRGRDILLIMLAGGAPMALFQVAYHLSTATAGVPVTVALVYLAPALVLAASGPLFGEWPSGAQVLWAGLTLGGVWLTVLGSAPAERTLDRPDVGWGTAAGCAYAAYTLVSRWAVSRFGVLATLACATAGSVVPLLLFVSLRGEGFTPPSDGRAWGVMVLFSVATIVVAPGLFLTALTRIEVGRASVATAAEPAVGALLASLLLAQRLDGIGWTGIALVAGGVALIGRATPPAPD